jgi:hypothetical protein
MLDLVARYEHFIKDFRVSLYEHEENIFRLKAKMIFTDGTTLSIKEYVFENKERKYAYHWADMYGSLICRWDNAGHWPNISTYPHLKPWAINPSVKNLRVLRVFAVQIKKMD